MPDARGWTSRDLLRAAGLFALVFVALRLLWTAHTIFFVGFLGVLFGLALAAGVDFLERWRIPRGVSAVGIVLVALGLVAGLFMLTAPLLRDQFGELRTQLPQALDRAEQWVQERQQRILGAMEGGGARPQPTQPTQQGQQEQQGQQREAQPAPQAQGAQGAQGGGLSVRSGISSQLRSFGSNFFAFLSSTAAVLGGILLTIAVAIYIAVDPETYERGIIHLIPHRARPRGREVLRNTVIMLRRWLVSQLVAMLLVGALTTAILLALGVPAAIPLGLIAGLLEFIPIFGPIIAAVPGVAMSFLESPQQALWVALAYTAVQQIEGNVVTPLVMKRGVELPPVLTILTQATMGLVFGFVGLLVAVPLLAAVMVPIKMLYVQDVVGDDVPLPEDAAGE